MRKGTVVLVIVILAVLQVTVLNFLRVYHTKPDLLLICAVIAGLTFELRLAVFFAALAGLLKDIFGVNNFGINTFLFALWAFLLVKLSKEISIENKFIRTAIVFIIVILTDIIGRFINYSIPIGIFLRLTSLESLYTAAVSLLIFKKVAK